MGVFVQVGRLDEMRQHGSHMYQGVKKEFAEISKALRKAGAPEYEEPDDLRGAGWSLELYPDNGLAYLQRFAAYCNENDDEFEWPTPGDPEATDDPLADEVLKDVYTLLEVMSFQHLILHDARWGFWVPVDFRDVIFPDKRRGIGRQLGSSVRLREECEELAKVLRLPLELDPEDEEVQAAVAHPGKGRARWKKYAVESYNLLAMYRACQKSIALGSAVFID